MKNKHHRKCKSRGGSDDATNISVVTMDKHVLWHAMFGNMTPPEIANEINNVWIDPSFEFVCQRRDYEKKLQPRHD
jgi:hypothetical protein